MVWSKRALYEVSGVSPPSWWPPISPMTAPVAVLIQGPPLVPPV